jgi:hypothetical protein
MDADGRKAAITALVGEGCTASGVAAKLSTTRNAILGFCHRNGLPFGAGAPATDAYGRMRPKNERSAAGGHATRKKAGVTLAGPAVDRRPGADDEIPAGSHGVGADPEGPEGNTSRGSPASPEPQAVASAVGPSCPASSAPAARPSPALRAPSPPPAGAGEGGVAGAIGFMALTDTRCKRPLWPNGAPPRLDAMLFCGAPSVAGSSWCRACAGRLLAGVPQPQRRAGRGLP